MAEDDPNPRALPDTVPAQKPPSYFESVAAFLTLDQQIAVETSENLGRYTPLLVDAPPRWLQTAVEQARALGRANQMTQAKAVVRQALADAEQRRELARYRNRLTWLEGENASKLSALAAAWHTLARMEPRNPRPLDVDRAMERIERFGHMNFGIQAFHEHRGWAEAQTKRTDLLPLAWRRA